MSIIHNKDLWNIICRTLGKIDTRLVAHGERVAYIVYKALILQNKLSEKEIASIIFVSLMHDIGAYKTEELDQMLHFETSDIHEHSIYGYLFLKNLSNFCRYSESILYHHNSYFDLKDMFLNEDIKNLAALIHIADQIDLRVTYNRPVESYLTTYRGTLFSPDLVDILFDLGLSDLLISISSGAFQYELQAFIDRITFTEEEKRNYLRAIAFSIDFRSEHMAVHTITTVSVCIAIASKLKLNKQQRTSLYYGSLLHDIGKIATPIEILEKPGGLTKPEMKIMKEHVKITGEILQDYINPKVYQIATRHHEKLDGSGYPLGLTGSELTIEDRICAVSDIVSALIRKRSYKNSFSPQQVCSILRNMADNNKICPVITTCVIDNFDTILEVASTNSGSVLSIYQELIQEYQTMMHQKRSYPQ